MTLHALEQFPLTRTLSAWRSMTWLCGDLLRRIRARESDTISASTSHKFAPCTGEPTVVLSDTVTVPGRTHAGVYQTEAALVRDFVDAIRAEGAPLQAVRIGSEFNYRDGRTDVITMSSDGEILAFEAKLTQWRVALHQAYRATSWAHRSYVVLPSNVAKRALRFTTEFDRRRVGLCAISADGTLHVLYAAPRVDPLMPWVSDRAVAYLKAQG